MKLSKIVGYLNHLETLSLEPVAAQVLGELEKINHVVKTSEIQIAGMVDSLTSNSTHVKLLLDSFEENLKKLRADVLGLIKQSELEYFTKSQELHQGMRFELPEHVLNRTVPIDKDTLYFLKSRLQLHTNWQHPGLVIRPAKSPWIEDLVALDPMYFVDTHQDLITHAIDKFTPQYKSRLRLCVIEEYSNSPIFCNLPKNQFGFVYSFFYFNFKPWEILQKYLTEVFALLRDGGTFLFNFNDCDHQEAVGLAENNFCCYTPGRLVRKYALSVGYEITQEYHDNAATTWLELRRPGILKSIRGGQALAIILKKSEPITEPPPDIDSMVTLGSGISDPTPEPVPVLTPNPVIETLPEVVDISIQDRYNNLDLSELIDLARMLSLDISNDKNKGTYNVKKVRLTIRNYLEAQNWPEKQLERLFKRKSK